MAKLCTIEDFLLSEGLIDQNCDCDDKVLRRGHDALEMVSLMLESELRTSFARAVRTDRFFNTTRWDFKKPDMVEFLLKQGFIDDAETFEVRLGLNMHSIADEQPLDASMYFVDNEKGVLTVIGGPDLDISTFTRPDIVSGRRYLQVDYTAGWDVEDDDIGSVYIAPPTIPEWLCTLAKSLASLKFDNLLECADDTKTGANKKPRVDLVNPLIASVLECHVRYKPVAELPLYSVVA